MYIWVSGICPLYLKQGQKMIQDTATQIALCERELGIDTSVKDYLNELKFGLVEVVYAYSYSASQRRILLNTTP